MATPTFSAKLPDVTIRQLNELSAQFGVSKSQIVIQAVRQLYQQEKKNMKNLTDNAWVDRVNELRQMVANLPDAPTSKEEIDYYLSSPDFFGAPAFDNADKTVLRREMEHQYNIE